LEFRNHQEVTIKLIILIVLFSSQIFAKSKLPELATKQAINNLRFLSSDGSFTYYQNREGSLLLSTNYKVKEVLNSTPGTNYQVISSPNRKKLIVVQQESFHKFLGIRQMKNIYKMDFGGQSASKLGLGINPRLHSSDEWVSIFHPISKTIKFINLKSSALKFDLKIRNPFNPYFIPEVIMPNNNTILYTDLNKDGLPGILYYDKITKQTSVLYKASNSAIKLELCLNKENIFLGEFGLDRLFSGSAISLLKSNAIDFSKREILYESRVNDIGNISCSNSLLFVQNLSKQRKKLAYELVELGLGTKRVKVLSDINFASHSIDMDGVILLPHLGKYYVVKGKSDYTKRDILKKSKVNE